MTTTRIIRMTIPRAPEPSREEWEADRRRVAEHLIETGEPYGYYDYSDNGPEYTAANSEEIDRLTPEAVRAVRLACGRAERDLREKHPAAAVVARGIEGPSPFTEEVVERWYAAEAALTGADKDAYQDLLVLRDIRSLVRKHGWYDIDEWVGHWQFGNWPKQYEPPTSPALDRLRALHAEGIQRRHDAEESVERSNNRYDFRPVCGRNGIGAGSSQLRRPRGRRGRSSPPD